MSQSPKVLIAVVHNFDPTRRQSIERTANALAEAFRDRLDYEIQYFGWQPVIRRTASLLSVINRQMLLARIDHCWRINVHGTSRLRSATILARHYASMLKSTPSLRTHSKLVTVERFVAAKHHRAWDALLESDSDFLIVLEDDATLPANISGADLSEIVDLLASQSQPSPGSDKVLYADIAGGLPPEAVMLQTETTKVGRWRLFVKPTTNTACGYILSRRLCEFFAEELMADPDLRPISIDWQINALFLLSSVRGLRVSCFHAEPPLLGHGSFLGTHNSWNR